MLKQRSRSLWIDIVVHPPTISMSLQRFCQARPNVVCARSEALSET
jgi:hypothetical protein